MRAVKTSYSKWIKLQERKLPLEVLVVPTQPLATFLLLVEEATLENATATFKSIQRQQSDGW